VSFAPLACVIFVLGLPACDSARKTQATAPAPSEHRPASPRVEAPAVLPETEHDDDHGPPAAPAAPAPTATALDAKTRAKLTTLRISAHRGGLIIRKEPEGWKLSGTQGCLVDAARVDRALDNLAGLTAVQTLDALAHFELQIVALIGQERALYFDVGERGEAGDLVQLGDQSRVRVKGLDRALWSPEPSAWCSAKP
jgi:hypothetical protein